MFQLYLVKIFREIRRLEKTSYLITWNGVCFRCEGTQCVLKLI